MANELVRCGPYLALVTLISVVLIALVVLIQDTSYNVRCFNEAKDMVYQQGGVISWDHSTDEIALYPLGERKKLPPDDKCYLSYRSNND